MGEGCYLDSWNDGCTSTDPCSSYTSSGESYCDSMSYSSGSESRSCAWTNETCVTDSCSYFDEDTCPSDEGEGCYFYDFYDCTSTDPCSSYTGDGESYCDSMSY